MSRVPKIDFAVDVLAAEVRDVGGHRAAADLQRSAVEADVGDVVLAAAVRATAHLDVDLTGERIGDVHLFDPLLDRLVQAHRAGDAHLAAVGAGAADHVGDPAGADVVETELAEALPDVVEVVVADPAQDDVLLDGRAGEATGVVTHDLAEAAELLGGQVTTDDRDLDRVEALLPLRLDVGLDVGLEVGAVTVRRARRTAVGSGSSGLFVEVEQQVVDREVALVDPVALELLVDHAADLVDADLVDQDLDPGAGTVGAQPFLPVEDPEDGFGDLEVVAVVGFDEVVEGRSDAGHDRGAATDPDLEALHAVLDPADEGDVVDAGDRAVGVGAGEGGLDLSRHQLRRGVAHEITHVCAGVGGRIEDLVVGDAGPRVAGHVADGVAAAFTRGQAARGHVAEHVNHLVQRDVMDLDVLAGRDVTLLQRRVRLDHVSEGIHLLGRDATDGQLDADHLDAGLALAVDTLLEAEADELGSPACCRRGTRSASPSKSSNSCSRIGMTWPGTLSYVSGLFSEPSLPLPFWTLPSSCSTPLSPGLASGFGFGLAGPNVGSIGAPPADL